MYYSTYFYDPIHGYCKCNFLYHRLSKESYHYLNQLRLKGVHYQRKVISKTHCQCFDDVFFGGQNFLTVRDDVSSERRKKYAPFPEGFQQVVYVKEVDFYNVGSRTHYLVCSLNLLNVKQVYPGVFEVGFTYELIQDSYTESALSEISDRLYPVCKVNVFLNDLSHLVNNFFDEDQKNYYESCQSIIEN